MRAIDAFLGEEHGNFGPGDAGNVAVVVDGAADLVLNHVQGFALGAHLFAGDGNAAYALGRALNQTVKVALPGRTDDHDVVRPVMSRHAHAADIVLKAPGGDFRGDDRSRLGVNAAEMMGRRQGHGTFQGSGAVPVGESAQL
jgi:hypothetical protein